MRNGQPKTVRKGGLYDPVAQSIRNEQQADAMPTVDEVRAERRKRMAADGCLVCGEDDPDVLTEVRVPLSFCRYDQHPRKPFETDVFCPEHRRPSKVLKRARMVQQARREGADALGIYSCGAVQTASWERPDDDALARRMGPTMADRDFDDLRMMTKDRIGQPPSLPAFHVGRRCGAELVEVIKLTD